MIFKNLGGRDIEAKFGIDFIKLLNQNYAIPVNTGEFTINISAGFAMINIYVRKQKDMEAIYNLIKYATATEKQKPSNQDIEEYLGTFDTEEKLDNFVEDFLTALETAPLTKVGMQKVSKIKD